MFEIAGIHESDPAFAELAEKYRGAVRREVERLGPDLVLPGATELLTALQGAGVSVAVVTAKNTSQARHLLQVCALEHLIDVLVGTDQVERGKPAPDPALLAADLLGVAPGECAYVGDAVTDVQMALAAGMECYGVITGAASGQDLAAAGARAVVARVDELAGRWLG